MASALYPTATTHKDNEGNEVVFNFVHGSEVWEIHINGQYECEYDAQDFSIEKLSQMYGVTL